MSLHEARLDGAGASTAWIPPGDFWMGSEAFYVEERPSHRVRMSGFWMDVAPVTNAAFGRFVAATGYVTVAERPVRIFDGAGFVREASPGSLVFGRARPGAPLEDVLTWWSFVPGAHWRCPQGPDSSIIGLDAHPVTQVSLDDARAYAAWHGVKLPTEAQWEYAARGGLDHAPFVWGSDFEPEGRSMANTWQGEFPQHSEGASPPGTTPVGTYPANGYGLLDMAGNVWEWTTDVYRAGHRFAHQLIGNTVASCCGAPVVDPRGSAPSQEGIRTSGSSVHVLKGGSFLCAPNYCFRARPAARIPQTVESATNHTGFRCVG